jgi:hypothetical protein
MAEGPPAISGFVLDLNDDEITDDGWQPCRYRVPITLRMKEHKILVWVEGEGDLYIHEDAVRGVRLRTRDSTDFQVTDFPLPGDGRATAHFVPGWPSIVLAQEKPEFTESSDATPFYAHFSAPNSGEDFSVEAQA